MNGAVEAANKNIKKIVQKITVSYKDWHEILPFASDLDTHINWGNLVLFGIQDGGCASIRSRGSFIEDSS